MDLVATAAAGGRPAGARRRGTALALAGVVLGVLGGGCEPSGAGDKGAEGGPGSDPMRFTHTLVAGPGPAVAGTDGAALPGTAPGLVWARVISPEVTHRLAEHYCGDLPPLGPVPWRIPAAGELAGAPLDRFGFEPGDRLWSETRPEDAHHRRVVIDPLTGALDHRAPAQALHLRVLCVTDAP